MNVTAWIRAKIERLGAVKARPESLAIGIAAGIFFGVVPLVAEREIAVENAERFFKRSEAMAASKGVSPQDRDNAEAGYHEAAARLESSRENLALLEAGFRREDIAQAKANLQQAEAALSIPEVFFNPP